MAEIISLGAGDTLGNSGVSGKVGIGTTSPSRTLHLAGSTNSMAFDVNDTYPRVIFGGQSPVINWDSNKSIYFGETNYTGYYLIRGCSVGIGTSTPTEKLHVNGNVKIDTGWYNGGHLVMGSYHLWIDTNGRLRIKSSMPSADTDGTVVGTQS